MNDPDCNESGCCACEGETCGAANNRLLSWPLALPTQQNAAITLIAANLFPMSLNRPIMF
jgi:hypothetical protein